MKMYKVPTDALLEIMNAMHSTIQSMLDAAIELEDEDGDVIRGFIYPFMEDYQEKVEFLKTIYQYEEVEVNDE